MSNISSPVFCFALIGLLPGAAAADSVEKAGYTLFNPVPDRLLRDLSTDRPDKTESAYTVDAGRFQIEGDFVSYGRRTDGGAHESSWNILPLNIKAGLTSSADLQLLFDPYQRVDESPGRRTEGVGDLTVRLKYNLWGNDDGATALSVMPFIKAPTNTNDLGNDAVEGGVIAPLAVDLGGGFGLGLMTELDLVRKDDDSGNRLSFINTATIGADLTDEVGGYAEFFSEIPEGQPDDWIGTVDFGLTWGLSRDIQLDAGVNIGITDSADDLAPFVGFAVRV